MRSIRKLMGLYFICQSMLIAHKVWFNSFYPISWKTTLTPTLVLVVVTMVLVGIGSIMLGNRKKRK